MFRTGVMLALTAVAGSLQATHDGKKCLAFGWEFRHRMSVKDLITAAPWFDMTPIDGVEIHLRMKTPSGESFGSQEFMEGPAWTEENCAATAEELKTLAKHRAFRSSFINTLRAPLARIPWTDDAAWSRIAGNMRVAASMAKGAGLPGLAMDPEDYSKCRQFFRMPGDPEYGELVKIVRRRSAEVVGAATKEYPGITLFFYWFLSFQERYTDWVDPVAAARDRGDLWPAFVNGVLDALPPAARVVDGDENAYRYTDAGFAEANVRWRESVIRFVAPENRAKYRRQVEISSGHYLDNYTNGPESRYYQPPLDGSRLKRLVSNYSAVRRATREYVWFWGEKYTWVNWPGDIKLGRRCKRETWDQRLPGLSEALSAVADPGCYFSAQLKRPGVPLVKNVKGLPVGFSTWQMPKGRQGVFSSGNGELRLEGMSRGSYSVPVEGIEPGKCYACICEAIGPGAFMSVRWKRPDGNWLPQHATGAFDGEDRNAWRKGAAFVRAPDGASKLILLLSAEGQAEGETARFRKIGVRRLRDFHQPEITGWSDILTGVESSVDGTVQPCWFWAPEKAKEEPVPLVVSLHTWGGSYRQLSHYRTVLDYAKKKGWAFIGSNFRGPNFTPYGCGSEFAVQDIADQIAFAKKSVRIDDKRVYIVGGSGGGHMTLLMVGRHPELFAAGAAFCPISDLAQWWRERSAPGARWHNYARNLVAACGGTPDAATDEYRKRSPITHLPAARAAGVPVNIVTGIHDGHTGSVPVGHALRAFNALADAGDAIPEDAIKRIEADEKVPAGLVNESCADPFYAKGREVLFRRTSGNARVTLFEGGHGGNFNAGLDFLSRQVKGRPADWTLPASASGEISALQK